MNIKSCALAAVFFLSCSVSQALANLLTNTSFATGCVGHECVLLPNKMFDQIVSTAPSQEYQLSFNVWENGGPTSEFAVYWNGNLVAYVLNPANNTPSPGVLFTYDLTASDISSELVINGRQDPAAIIFTNIDLEPLVAAVPEPSTWAMMILGFVGIGFLAYRKKSTLRFA